MSRIVPVAITSPIMQEKLGELLRKKNQKLYLIYLISLQTGIPVTILLKKHIGDVRDKENIDYVIRVTNYSVPFSKELKEELSSYCIGKKDDDWLFPGKQPDQPYPLLTVQRSVTSTAMRLNLSDVTIKSIRKTFLYNEYCRGALTLQQFIELTGHPSSEQLKRCYGIDYQYPDSPKSSEKIRIIDDKSLADLFLKMDQVKYLLLTKEKIATMSEEDYTDLCGEFYKLDSALSSWQKYIK